MREILDKTIAEGQLDQALESLPLWAKIWPASVILAHLVSKMPGEGRTLLEIGAGCGLAGLMAAAAGFERVLITDLNEEALLFARINILKNGLEKRAQVRRLDIRDPEPSLTDDGRFSLILGSEILYLDYLYRPLVKFLKRRLLPASHQPPGEALLASDHRRGARGFFKRAEKDFHISRKEIALGERNAEGERAERHLLAVYRLKPKEL